VIIGLLRASRLGLGKLGNSHIEFIKAGELRAPQKMPQT
jgi:hypothetical protein